MARVLALRSWLLLAGLLLLARCSVLYGSPPSAQCSTNADCERQPALSGRTCNTDHGVCEAKTADVELAAGGCESSGLCTAQEGVPSLCRAHDTPCIRLETPECRVQGRWDVANALFIGSIGPHTLRRSNGGTVPIAWTPRATQALDLGLGEWNERLPDGLLTSNSPLAIIHCNSAGDPEQIARVLDQLLDTVHVRALIALGDIERNAIADRARDSEIPVVCAGCYERVQGTSTAGVTSWRVQPALVDQAPLVVRRTSDLEQRIRSERSLAEGAPIRVALVGQDSPGNEAFVLAVGSQLRFNGGLTAMSQSGTNYLQLATPNPTRQDIDALGVSQTIVDFQPDVLIAGMDSDFAAVYLTMVEQQWPAERPRPFYILSMQNRELGLLETLGRHSDDLLLRVSGTAPVTSAAVAQNRDGFAERFLRAYDVPADETQSAYDAFYATAYAFFVADGDRQYTTARFAQSVAQLAAGPRINVGPDEIPSAAPYLVAGESIDLVGSASELVWDTSTGGVDSDACLWCLSRDAQGELRVQDDAGVHWDRTTGEVTGPYSCPPLANPP